MHLDRVEFCVGEHRRQGRVGWIVDTDGLVELLIFDESERLSMTALEFIRDRFDRTGAGVVPIGMSGMEKRLARYPQLYSRVSLATTTARSRATSSPSCSPAAGAGSIARTTGGNLRLLQRLFVQIGRILKVSGLAAITDDVVQAARATVVIGATSPSRSTARKRWRSRLKTQGKAAGSKLTRRAR